ncbi:MAG TPA: NADH-quinone oxidoreductase subunit C [Anaerolineae bacterium]|nr:NADH-quinone oxidoreductase subunit C [Anaerolineae bacterium]
MSTDTFVVDKIKKAFPDAIEEIIDFRGEQTVVINGKHLQKIVKLLRDDETLRFDFLTDICADDYLPETPRFAVNYHFYSTKTKAFVRLRVMVEDPDKGVDTLGELWRVATWLEMEVWDLMGINFKGNGALRRLFLPEDWQGHPLRKDYPLGYEEVQFSFNWREVGERKPHPQD